MFHQNKFFSSILFYLLFLKMSSSTMDRIIQESAIYASHSKDGENIAWSKDPDWSNLNDVLKENGMTDITELCIQGTWLLYEKPEYEVSEKTGYRMFTGEYRCAQKPGTVMSMQPFGSEGVTDSSITFFSEKYFGAKAFPLSTDTTRTTMDLFYGAVKSLIVVGTDDWTVLMESSDSSTKLVCIRPEPVQLMKTMAICSLQNVEFTALEPNIKILFASKGCADATDEASTIVLSDCKPFEDPTPETPDLSDMEEVPKTRGIGSGGAKNVLSCNGGTPNDELMVLLRFLKLRRENDFRNDPVIPWTNSNENTWKSEIADMSFEIAMAACPQVAVNSDFLQMAREAFMFELQEAWSNGAPEVDNKEVGMLTTQLHKCIFKSKDGASDKVRSMTMDKLTHSVPFTESTSIHPQLQWNATNNLVVDIAWIVANLVASLCHTSFQYENNFWYNYIRIFTDLYLEPLAKSNNWKNGQASRERHNIFLSGFGIDFQLSGIALCASNAVRINPNMEPFQRP